MSQSAIDQEIERAKEIAAARRKHDEHTARIRPVWQAWEAVYVPKPTDESNYDNWLIDLNRRVSQVIAAIDKAGLTRNLRDWQTSSQRDGIAKELLQISVAKTRLEQMRRLPVDSIWYLAFNYDVPEQIIEGPRCTECSVKLAYAGDQLINCNCQTRPAQITENRAHKTPGKKRGRKVSAENEELQRECCKAKQAYVLDCQDKRKRPLKCKFDSWLLESAFAINLTGEEAWRLAEHFQRNKQRQATKA